MVLIMNTERSQDGLHAVKVRHSRRKPAPVAQSSAGKGSKQIPVVVECCFTSTENIRLIRDGSPGRPPRLSHSSWALQSKYQVKYGYLYPEKVSLCQRNTESEQQSTMAPAVHFRSDTCHPWSRGRVWYMTCAPTSAYPAVYLTASSSPPWCWIGLELIEFVLLNSSKGVQFAAGVDLCVHWRSIWRVCLWKKCFVGIACLVSVYGRSLETCPALRIVFYTAVVSRTFAKICQTGKDKLFLLNIIVLLFVVVLLAPLLPTPPPPPLLLFALNVTLGVDRMFKSKNCLLRVFSPPTPTPFFSPLLLFIATIQNLSWWVATGPSFFFSFRFQSLLKEFIVVDCHSQSFLFLFLSLLLHCSF